MDEQIENKIIPSITTFSVSRRVWETTNEKHFPASSGGSNELQQESQAVS